MTSKKNLKKVIVPGGHGYAFKVSKNQCVKITDLEGKQVIDFLAFHEQNHKEFLSVTHTRSVLRRLFLKVGDQLVINYSNPFVEIVEDTVGIHDLMVACCDQAKYAQLGLSNHRSCRQNFTEVLEPYGIQEWRLPDPFNIFQNTPVYADGTWGSEEPPSKKGSYIILRLLEDALCAVSACPYDQNGFNGGKSTPIEIALLSS